MSDKILQYIDRRNFLVSLSASPFLDEELKKRKNENTLPVQIELIKVFYKLAKKLDCLMTLTVPILHNMQDIWRDFKIIPIISVNEEMIILLSIEDIGIIEERHSWITGNQIRFDNPNIPEMLNFNGNKIPFFEMFRLQLNKNSADFTIEEVLE